MLTERRGQVFDLKFWFSPDKNYGDFEKKIMFVIIFLSIFELNTCQH